MASDELTVQARDITRHITMHMRLRGVRILNLRVRLGVWMIRCAAAVMGVDVEVETASKA